jgi:hypothetical protein
MLSPRAGLCPVGADPVNPGVQRRRSVESVDTFEHGEPGLVHNLLGD